jgi:nitrite reductase (NADH) small subunit
MMTEMLSMQERPRDATVMSSNWVDICSLDEILPGTGVAALVEGEQIAILRSSDGEQIYAISNFDPFSHAFVLSRGIQGDRGGIPKVASPIYKQNFDLRTGECLDDPKVRIPVFPVRVAGGRVSIDVTVLRSLETPAGASRG